MSRGAEIKKKQIFSFEKTFNLYVMPQIKNCCSLKWSLIGKKNDENVFLEKTSQTVISDILSNK